MICTPKSLAVAATPLTALSWRQKQAAKLSLLCKINTVGLVITPIPAPTGFSVVITGDGTQFTGTWDAPPASAAQTNVYKSTDGVNYTLYTTVAAPGTSASDVASTVAVGQVGYYKIAWAKGGNVGPQTAPQRVSGRVADWAHRVIVNGGGSLTAQTMAAMNTFDLSIMDNGIMALIAALNVFAPDSLIAALTPFVKGVGVDPWTNHNFVAGDLSVNGLRATGNLGSGGTFATAKWLGTGFVPSVAGISATSAGYAIYEYSTNTASFAVEIGTASSNATNDDWFFCAAYNGAGFAIVSDNMGAGTGRLSKTTFYGPGFYSAQRTSAASHQIYFANSTTSFASIAGNTSAAGAAPAGPSVSIFAENRNGTVDQWGDARLSFVAITTGLTSAQTQSLYNLVQALRQALGGGFT
jgi:hypothetical protein